MLLLVLHLVVRVASGTMKDGLDAVALCQILAALSPCTATVIKTFKFGGFEVSFREVAETVERQGIEIEQIKCYYLPPPNP